LTKPAHKREAAAENASASVTAASADAIQAALSTTRPSAERDAEPVGFQLIADAIGDALTSAMRTELEAFAAAANAQRVLPGPTGETNRLSYQPRGTIVCAGPTADDVRAQAVRALLSGNRAICFAPSADAVLDRLATETGMLLMIEGAITPEALEAVFAATDVGAVLYSSPDDTARAPRSAMARRDGPILQLHCDDRDLIAYVTERHLCVDTTAAGGNAALLAATDAPKTQAASENAAA
ncbi:MAG: bifunctional proline dehydrogenase/L-glutamate gamma-semialdehyde dehydrogenase, partial [Pseudomonadota bacterium]